MTGITNILKKKNFKINTKLSYFKNKNKNINTKFKFKKLNPLKPYKRKPFKSNKYLERRLLLKKTLHYKLNNPDSAFAHLLHLAAVARPSTFKYKNKKRSIFRKRRKWFKDFYRILTAKSSWNSSKRRSKYFFKGAIKSHFKKSYTNWRKNRLHLNSSKWFKATISSRLRRTFSHKIAIRRFFCSYYGFKSNRKLYNVRRFLGYQKTSFLSYTKYFGLRLDMFIVKLGWVVNRQSAQYLIIKGFIKVNFCIEKNYLRAVKVGDTFNFFKPLVYKKNKFYSKKKKRLCIYKENYNRHPAGPNRKPRHWRKDVLFLMLSSSLYFSKNLIFEESNFFIIAVYFKSLNPSRVHLARFAQLKLSNWKVADQFANTDLF